MMVHMYFASHPSGPREILYKAELANIAYYIDLVPAYDILGSTPEKIVGHGLPLKLLRILNRWDFIEYLFEEEKMNSCCEVYRKYSGYLGEKPVNIGQWRYLEELSNPAGVFYGMKFNRVIYEYMNDENYEDMLEDYRCFFDLRSEFSEIKKIKLPDPENIYHVVLKLEEFNQYQAEYEGIDELFKLRKTENEYEYCGREYSVVMPDSSFDICLEALSQRTCVMDYMYTHANGKATILFVRKNDSIDKSFVTIKVNQNRWISEVRGKCNNLPDEDVYLFLEEYAQKTRLFYNPYVIIDAKSISTYNYLSQYIEDYKQRHILPGDYRFEYEGVEYRQISMTDLYPDLFEDEVLPNDNKI